jgi:hypothetical protein
MNREIIIIRARTHVHGTYVCCMHACSIAVQITPARPKQVAPGSVFHPAAQQVYIQYVVHMIEEINKAGMNCMPHASSISTTYVVSTLLSQTNPKRTCAKLLIMSYLTNRLIKKHEAIHHHRSERYIASSPGVFNFTQLKIHSDPYFAVVRLQNNISSIYYTLADA